MWSEIKKIKSGKKELREFGLLVGGVLAAIGGLMLWHQKTAYPYFLGTGAALIVLGVLAPSVLKPVQKAWMTFALLMGFVMTRLILGVIFFVVLTPIALIVKLTGKKFLDLSFKNEAETFWVEHRQITDKAEYENQF